MKKINSFTIVLPLDKLYCIPTVVSLIKSNHQNIDSLIIQKNFFNFKRFFFFLILINPIYLLNKIINSFNNDKILFKIIKKKKINYIFTNNINSPESCKFLHNSKSEALIILSCSQILKKKILKIKKINLNFHCSDLPLDRGLFPIVYTFIRYSGKFFFFCIHKIDEKIDNGYLLLKKKYINKRKKNLLEIYEIAYNKFIICFKNLTQGNYEYIKNDRKKMSYNSYLKLRDLIKFYKT